MIQKFKQGEVWLAKVYFKNEAKFKHRPVAIVGRDITVDIDVISSPITSSEPRNEFDVVIEYWQEAGLKYPSVARTTKISSIPQSAFIKKMGDLNIHDLDRVLMMCRSLF